MGRLIYTAIASLDGYVADQQGEFAWSAPDEEVHRFINDRERDIGTYLIGRRLYDVMVVWETMPTAGESPVIADYAEIWRAAEKVVYSTTLEEVGSRRTRIERAFEPDAIRRMVAGADHDVSVGGANLAAQALRASLVDELQLFLTPVIVGGGTPALPPDLRMRLELTDQRRFTNGTVFLQYAVAPSE